MGSPVCGAEVRAGAGRGREEVGGVYRAAKMCVCGCGGLVPGEWKSCIGRRFLSNDTNNITWTKQVTHHIYLRVTYFFCPT